VRGVRRQASGIRKKKKKKKGPGIRDQEPPLEGDAPSSPRQAPSI